MKLQAAYYDQRAGYEEMSGQKEAAVQHYWQAFQLDSVDDESIVSAARLALDIGSTDDALRFLNIVIERRPTDPWAHRRRGFLLENKFNRFDKAFEDYKVAAENDDTFSQSRLGFWYATGVYVKIDEEMAEKYWRLAAKKGDKHAIGNLDHLAKVRAARGGSAAASQVTR
jgi:TPR repeat protein